MKYKYHLDKIISLFKRNEKTDQKVIKKQFSSKSNFLSSKCLVLKTPVWSHGNIYIEPQLEKRDTSPFNHFIKSKISDLWGLKGQKIAVKIICGDWGP